MYLIYQNSDSTWTLKLSIQGLTKKYTFKKYVQALEAVNALRLELNYFETSGQPLKRIA